MYRRHAERKLRDALTDTPSVLIHGPRQSGKSTLAEEVTQLGQRRLVTLDDPVALGLAKRDPIAFLEAHPTPLTIDEIQRAPELFLPIKLHIDRDRQAGRFLLTGSANVLALPKLSDSLAGRIEIVDLLPLSQGEISGKPDEFVDAVFEEDFNPVIDVEAPEEIFERVTRGGFPEAVKRSGRRRSDWFENYIRTLLDRDVRDLANLEALTQMPLLLSLLATRAGGVLNVASLSTDVGLPYTTLRRYLGLLEIIFILRLVPTWSMSKGATFTKAPKAYFNDTGLLCHLLKLDAKALVGDPVRSRTVLENFVATELVKQCAYGDARARLLHLRTVRHLQVDFVLETRSLDVVGVDLKAAKTLHPNDANGLRFLREISGSRFKRGIVLYLGSDVVPLDDRILAVPLSALWCTARTARE